MFLLWCLKSRWWEQLSCWLEVWAKPENLASLLVSHPVKSQKSEIFTFCKTVKIRLSDQKILKSFTYLINFHRQHVFKTVCSNVKQNWKIHFKKNIIQQIQTHILINVRQINQIKRNIRRFDDIIVFKVSMQSRFRIFNSEMKTALLKYLNQKFDAYCDEMCWFLYNKFKIVMTKKTMSIIFNHLN